MTEKIQVRDMYNNVQHNFPLSNIFHLESPDTCVCRIEKYEDAHNDLFMLVYDNRKLPGQHLYEIWFTMLLYYAGPIEWTGANFCIAPPEVCIQFVKQHIAQFAHTEDSVILSGLLLFTVDNPLTKIRIVAARGERYEYPHFRLKKPTNTKR